MCARRLVFFARSAAGLEYRNHLFVCVCVCLFLCLLLGVCSQTLSREKRVGGAGAQISQRAKDMQDGRLNGKVRV